MARKRANKKKNKIAMSVFRHSQGYSELLRNWDIAVEKIWPEWHTGNCVGISHEPDDLERLCVAAYALMKHIRMYLKKKRLDYNEQVRFPNLYTALQDAVQVTKEARCALHIEAEKLEQCSRAAYHWMKTYKMLGRPPEKKELERKPVCKECHEKPVADDAGILCANCSGLDGSTYQGKCWVCKTEDAAPGMDGLCDFCGEGATGYSPPPVEDKRANCMTCNSPAVDPQSLFCDACGAENRIHSGVSRIHSSVGPFDDDGYPLDGAGMGSWREPGDMMFMNRMHRFR